VSLPSGLSTLAFGDGFNQSLDGATLPTELQSLAFGDRFNHSLEIPSLKGLKGLRRLILGYDFDQNPDGLTLPSLRSLTLGRSDSFGNKRLEQMTFPIGLQSLVLGPFGNLRSQYLQMVTFPSTLQSLTFGEEFNQVLQMQFPSGLKHLTFGYKFNQSLHVHLPDGLESLKFGEEFNQSLENVTLPSALRSLTFGEAFNCSLNHTVPWRSERSPRLLPWHKENIKRCQLGQLGQRFILVHFLVAQVLELFAWLQLALIHGHLGSAKRTSELELWGPLQPLFGPCELPQEFAKLELRFLF
jgi:hypothetical protein